MHCRHVLLYGYITETDNNQIGQTNFYSHLGIVKNPEFHDTENPVPDIFDNRIAIVTDDIARVETDGILVQLDDDNNVTFSGKVHEIDETANTVYLSEYMGPYTNIVDSDSSFDINKNLVNSLNQQITINTDADS